MRPIMRRIAGLACVLACMFAGTAEAKTVTYKFKLEPGATKTWTTTIGDKECLPSMRVGNVVAAIEADGLGGKINYLYARGVVARLSAHGKDVRFRVTNASVRTRRPRIYLSCF